MKVFVTGGTGNVERARKIAAGEEIVNVYHVW